MVNLLWEIWVWAIQEDGAELHMLTLAGPDGDEQRALNEPGAKLLHTFEADSRFGAMNYYNHLLGRERYTAHYPEDFAPFTKEQADRQKAGGRTGSSFGETSNFP